MTGPILAAQSLGYTALKKRRSGGELLSTLRPIRPNRERNPEISAPRAMPLTTSLHLIKNNEKSLTQFKHPTKRHQMTMQILKLLATELSSLFHNVWRVFKMEKRKYTTCYYLKLHFKLYLCFSRISHGINYQKNLESTKIFK